MASRNPKISIIIPFYNEEKDIERCLNSVLMQTFTDFECILVDDGSTDHSPEICDRYASMDRRFKVIRKAQNEGQPKGRKTGLDNAVSEFVMHCDGDDWLEPDALAILFENQKSTNASIVRTNQIYHFKNKSCQIDLLVEHDRSSDPLVWYLLNFDFTLHGILYKKDLFADYIIPDIIANEDGFTNIQIFSKIKPGELCFVKSAIYNYDCHDYNINKYNNFTLTIWDDPCFKSMAYMKTLLTKQGKDSDEILSAYSFSIIMTYIIPCLLNKKKLYKKEISYFYSEFWKKCKHKYLLYKSSRFLVSLLNFSLFLGNIYRKAIYYPVAIIDQFSSRCISVGVIAAVKYYYEKYFGFRLKKTYIPNKIDKQNEITSSSTSPPA
jgi:glycosyltransferase involved in cell wall biosynthesis